MKVSIKSPFQFIQLWAWERFVELSPIPGVINLGQPRLARWDKVNGVEFENLRRVLDSAGDGFKWRPYAFTIENW
ncbi:putative aminotransferase-like, plant mobile domain-containing protein [Rosa chinensis]|uniref:Putative aminotransferase-like, plant mobile domain-containing protein n=1 Tax=Rosa chinensis TaxID=74649 RepID=A0A2P6QC52_ROSCH|nr:putative aminotransferase-like, plant mobile domain-containing protein [Rosa chinensis]